MTLQTQTAPEVKGRPVIGGELRGTYARGEFWLFVLYDDDVCNGSIDPMHWLPWMRSNKVNEHTCTRRDLSEGAVLGMGLFAVVTGS